MDSTGLPKVPRNEGFRDLFGQPVPSVAAPSVFGPIQQLIEGLPFRNVAAWIGRIAGATPHSCVEPLVTLPMTSSPTCCSTFLNIFRL